MTLLTVRSLKKDFGIKEILKDASFSLDDRDKVGLIGTNGSGKSTLLKMIAGLEAIDGGEIQINSGMKIVYLPQQPDLDNDKTVLEQVFADSGESMTLIKEYEELSDRLVHEPENLDTIMERLSRVSQQIEQTKARFDKYSKSDLLCGTDGLPHLIADGRWSHPYQVLLDK